jgi:hypothetical protein
MLCSPACRWTYCARLPSPYTAGFLRRVEELIGQGISRSKVAEILGSKKTIVSGVCWRYGFKAAVMPRPERKPKPERAAPAARAPRWAPRPSAKPAKPAKQPRVPSRREVADRLKAEALREAAPIRVSLDTMPGSGCQFPISDAPWRVCDDPRVPSSPAAMRLSPYCAVHVRRAYLKRAA